MLVTIPSRTPQGEATTSICMKPVVPAKKESGGRSSRRPRRRNSVLVEVMGGAPARGPPIFLGNSRMGTYRLIFASRQCRFRRRQPGGSEYLPSLVRTWAPDGKMCGHEWQALNPTRPDKNPGSFSVNTRTGRWADFATGDKGGDPVSLAAYIFGPLKQMPPALLPRR